MKKTVLIGYACDEGVRRNKGRVGAKDGPEAIRRCLHDLTDFDRGDVICEEGHMEKAQDDLAKRVADELSLNHFPLVLGGGHDIAFGHFKGIHQALKGDIGIINFDAHFDLRPFEAGGNSGTPFHQIGHMLASENRMFHYLPIGIRRESNSTLLFQTAERLGVGFIPMEDCKMGRLEEIQGKIQSFIDQVDHIYLTIDLDGFSSVYAPGVSAASQNGFNPQFVLQLLPTLFDSGKVVSCDVAEMNPLYDKEQKTAKLAALLLNRIQTLVTSH